MAFRLVREGIVQRVNYRSGVGSASGKPYAFSEAQLACKDESGDLDVVDFESRDDLRALQGQRVVLHATLSAKLDQGAPVIVCKADRVEMAKAAKAG